MAQKYATKEEFGKKLKAANDKCNADPKTELHGDDIKKWRKDGGEEPANLGSHALCMSKELGWQGADGKVAKDHIREGLSRSLAADKVDEVMNKCCVDQENEVETAKHLFRYLMEEARKHHDDH